MSPADLAATRSRGIMSPFVPTTLIQIGGNASLAMSGFVKIRGVLYPIIRSGFPISANTALYIPCELSPAKLMRLVQNPVQRWFTIIGGYVLAVIVPAI